MSDLQHAADAEALPPPHHEQRDVTLRLLVMLLGGALLGVVCLALLAAWMFPRTATVGIRPQALVAPTQPALQSSPRIDMAALRHQQRDWLNSAGWVDKAHGVAHIPVARAMHDIVAGGLPGWTR